VTQPADPTPDDVDNWLDAHDNDPDLHLHDLKDQGLTAMQLYTMTTIEPAGSYL
jgi:hypothetical protein